MPVSPLFWIAAGCVIIAQGMILRSTFRVLRGAAGNAGGAAGRATQRGRALEWVFALAPALALAVLLAWSWRAATLPTVMDVRW